jgi:drug/metabolite transporter (DMT)-like permease
MFINGLKQVSAYMASIITMLEPLYSIVLAYLLLGERLNVNTLIGGIIILSTVVFISLDNLKRKTI